MGTDVERVERYLRGVVAPSCASDEHRRQLRRQILGEMGNRQTVLVRGRIWKIAVAAVVLVCLGGTVGVWIGRGYPCAGRRLGGIGRLVGQDSAPAYSVSTPTPDANSATNIVPTAQEIQKTGVPPQSGDVEAVTLIELEAGSRRDRRTPVLQYAMAEGRTKTVRQDGPGARAQTLLTGLPQADWLELSQLQQAGKGENLGTEEQQLKGRAFVFQRERYTLHNGTRVIVSVGAPKEAP